MQSRVNAAILATALLPWQALAGPTPLADPIPEPIAAGPFMLTLTDVVSTLNFAIDAQVPADGSGRIFVTERGGVVRIVQQEMLLPEPFLDISATTVNNAGSALSSVVFHPQFSLPGTSGEGKLYTVSQEAPGSGAADFGAASPVFHQSVVYEWRVDAGNPDTADIASRREVLRINESTSVHNVNDMAFGPDGYLYLSKGDDDLNASGVLDGTTIHGAILRIDVNVPGVRYAVPPDNPFVADPQGRLDVIYAYGFRNPWRIAFDTTSGWLYVADIGEDDIEEVNRVTPGGFYGWNYLEGSFAFLDFNGVSDDLSELPPDLEHIVPVAQYDHTEGDRSITGGYVYRGAAIPSLRGQYVFADWVSGRLFHMDPNTLAIAYITIDPAGAALTPGVISFAEDANGELLMVIVDQSAGGASRLVAITGGSAPGFDSDGDGVDDDIDNCTVAANGPVLPDAGGFSQRDTDGDGFGNVCDPDLDDDLAVNFLDLAMMKAAFFGADDDADLNGDGVVNFTDLGTMKQLFFNVPGPSAFGPASRRH